MGCLLSTILVTEVVIDFKFIFWDPTDHPRPFLGGAQKGSRGSKLKLKDKCHVGCLFSTFLVKEVVIDFKDIIWEPNWPPKTLPWWGSKGVQGIIIEVEGYMWGVYLLLFWSRRS